MRIGLIVALASFVLPLSAGAANYKVDPGHSSIIFKAQHFGAGYTYGTFRKFSGELVVDGNKSSVKLEVEAASVFTGIRKRDGHLASPDFLNAKQFPKISFQSTRVSKRGKSFTVTGKLTLHGQTKKVKVKMKQTGKGKNPQGKEIIGFEGSLTIKRKDYGMGKMIGPVSNAVTLIIAVEGVAQ